jgi:hypothetical protein
MGAPRRGAWTGTAKTLLLSVDVGTTFTAASFTILEPDKVPIFYEVRKLLAFIIILSHK